MRTLTLGDGLITIKENISEKFKNMTDATVQSLRKFLETASIDSIALMKRRIVKEGMDIKGSRFVKYSPAYAAWKSFQTGRDYSDKVDLFGAGTGGPPSKKKGKRKAKKGNTGSPGGQLMASIMYEVDSPTTSKIFVSGAPAVYGLAHQLGLGNQPKREWFGFGNRETTHVQKLFKKWFEEEVKNA